MTGLPVRVFRPDAARSPEYLAGAIVRVGCAELVTKHQTDMAIPQAVLPVPTGRYFAQAVWTDPTTGPAGGFQWRSPRKVVDIPGPPLDIEVFPPKQNSPLCAHPRHSRLAQPSRH